ncbi:MAG TPA: glycosyltransferase [Thermoanaerobaculia bacterium]
MPRDRLRIDFVSPLPPVRSGIADYSADLLPQLARLCDLRLVRLPEQPVDPAIAARHPVVAPERLGEDGRLPCYQMGNNRHHAAVWDLAFEHPGVLTLHDVVLHHLLVERTLRRGDVAAYRRELAAEHGWIGDAAARPRQWPGGWGDAALFALPAHRRLAAAQRGVLVHSEWAAEWLREEVPGVAVAPVPMGVPLPPVSEKSDKSDRSDMSDSSDFRRRHNLPADVPLLGSFGFQTPIKRTGVVIQALRRLEGVHLVVAGEVASTLDLGETARRAGVAERVHLLGYLPFAELAEAIAAVDVCLNLRYPTAGETSASLLRILAVGKPTVVSDHAQLAALPDGVVVKAPLGDGEEAALAAQLAELLADPARLRAMGEAARRHVAEHHDPARAAAAMADALGRFAGRRPLGAVAAPPPPTSLFADRLAGELEVEGAEAPWPEGERRRLRIRLANRGGGPWLAGEVEDGGVAVEVRTLAAGAACARWLRLPLTLEPGAEHVFELALRRPPGRARLEVEPHVLGRQGFSGLGGPVWGREV